MPAIKFALNPNRFHLLRQGNDRILNIFCFLLMCLMTVLSSPNSLFASSSFLFSERRLNFFFDIRNPVSAPLDNTYLQ